MNDVFFCQRCRGFGLDKNETCPECHGAGVWYWTGNYVLLWTKIIDQTHIAYRKSTAFVKNGLDTLLLIYGITGCFFLTLALFQIRVDSLESLLRIWNYPNVFTFIFWSSVITDSYLLYRFMRRLESKYRLPKDLRNFSDDQKPDIPWNTAHTIPSKKIIDLSRACTQEAFSAYEKAYEAAQKYHHTKIAPIHIFVALLQFREIITIFLRLGVSFKKLKAKIDSIMRTYDAPVTGKPIFTLDFRQAQIFAFLHGYSAKKRIFDVADVLMGVIRSSDAISEMLYDLDIDSHKIENVALWSYFTKSMRERLSRMRAKATLRPKSGMNRAMTAVATPLLDSMSEDLTLQARYGILEPCIGRDKEIQQVFDTLSGGTRQNVVLVGEAGMGKRTIIHGIAQLMVSEDVPSFLQDKRLVLLSVSRLVSGANASVAEERLLNIMHEILRSGNIILCIHEISRLIGISSGTSGGSLDLAGVLAEMLSKKQIKVISTATPEEYTHYIEGSSSLGDVLEKVEVKEIDGNAAILVLESKSGIIEYKYRTFFTYDAIVKSIALSDKFMHERYLPEKAIEILEETASRVVSVKGTDAVITDTDIAETVSIKTEIPLSDVSEKESEKLLHLEDKIHERMIDQNEAVQMAASALRRARTAMRDEKRPIVNLLFLGPTGVGKTQLAKTLAEVYFGGENKMIRLDMSEYQEKSSIYRMIGYPAGPQGAATEGMLTEQIRHHPFSLLLLDEIEKAHPDIVNVFLQVMDDARMTDAHGRTIDFSSVIIICTSNACTPTIQKRITQNRTPREIREEIINGELLEYFRPEFLNRFDGIVIFRPLSKDDIREITRLLLKEVAGDLEKRGIRLHVTDGAVDELAELGFDPLYGARPLRRVIQQQVDDVIANSILSKSVERRDTIVVDVGGKIDIIKAKKF